MVNPSHPGNVGSAARAIKTMGFSELVLVGPKFADVTRQPEAVALASGAWMCWKTRASTIPWKRRWRP